MLKKLTIAAVIIASTAVTASARDQIRAVGSSTVYPFVTVAAEQYGKKTKSKTPIVEATGTGGGFKLFCESDADTSPDFANASRRIKPEELLTCFKNDVKQIGEIKIGYDGIVVANANTAPKFNLSLKDLFLALARKVPAKDDQKKLVDNYYKNWNEINPDLPKQKIEVYGPPPTSGTRDAFVELAMETGCKNFEAFKLAYPSEDERKKGCHLIREDGAFIEAGENDNLIVQKLISNKNAVGVFGYSFLKENSGKIQGSTISGVAPTHDTIADSSYILSRPLYVYAKRSHIGKVPGIAEFIKELTSDDAISEFGYLSERGLIALPTNELKAVQADAASGKLLQNLAEEKAPAAKAAAPAAAPATEAAKPAAAPAKTK